MGSRARRICLSPPSVAAWSAPCMKGLDEGGCQSLGARRSSCALAVGAGRLL